MYDLITTGAFAGLTIEQVMFGWQVYRAREKVRAQKRRTISVFKQVGLVALAGVASVFLPAMPWWGRIGLGVGSGLIKDPSFDAVGLGLAASSPLLGSVSRAVTRQIRTRDMPEADRPSFYGDIIIPALIWAGTTYGPQYSYWRDWWTAINQPYAGDPGVFGRGGSGGLYAW